jgi:hypothetical protein
MSRCTLGLKAVRSATEGAYRVVMTLLNNPSIKNGVFWVVTPCGSCKNRRFGGSWRLLHQGDKNR